MSAPQRTTQARADFELEPDDSQRLANLNGPFDAHHIFDTLPKDALQTQALKLDLTFWCYACGGMASTRTCPHTEKEQLQVSGTQLRKWLEQGDAVPKEFSRTEVLEILREYYAGLKAG